MKKGGEWYVAQFFYLHLQTLIYKKNETIEILDGGPDSVDGRFFNFVSG